MKLEKLISFVMVFLLIVSSVSAAACMTTQAEQSYREQLVDQGLEGTYSQVYAAWYYDNNKDTFDRQGLTRAQSLEIIERVRERELGGAAESEVTPDTLPNIQSNIQSQIDELKERQKSLANANLETIEKFFADLNALNERISSERFYPKYEDYALFDTVNNLDVLDRFESLISQKNNQKYVDMVREKVSKKDESARKVFDVLLKFYTPLSKATGFHYVAGFLTRDWTGILGSSQLNNVINGINREIGLNLDVDLFAAIIGELVDIRDDVRDTMNQDGTSKVNEFSKIAFTKSMWDRFSELARQKGVDSPLLDLNSEAELKTKQAGGLFSRQTNTIYLGYTLREVNGFFDQIMVHEMTHYYWYNFMSVNQRQEWLSYLKSQRPDVLKLISISPLYASKTESDWADEALAYLAESLVNSDFRNTYGFRVTEQELDLMARFGLISSDDIMLFRDNLRSHNEQLDQSLTETQARVDELGSQLQDSFVDGIRKLFGYDNFDRKLEAIRELRTKGKLAVPVLIKALNDPDWRVQSNAIMALGDIKDPSAVPALVSFQADSQKRHLYIRVIGSLKLIGTVDAIEGITKFLITPSDSGGAEIEAYAEQALISLGVSPDTIKDERAKILLDRTISDVVKDIPIITPEIKQWYQGLEEGFLRANFPALSDVQLKEVLDSDDRVQTLSDLGYSDNEIMLRMGGLPAVFDEKEYEQNLIKDYTQKVRKGNFLRRWFGIETAEDRDLDLRRLAVLGEEGTKIAIDEIVRDYNAAWRRDKLFFVSLLPVYMMIKDFSAPVKDFRRTAIDRLMAIGVPAIPALQNMGSFTNFERSHLDAIARIVYEDPFTAAEIYGRSNEKQIIYRTADALEEIRTQKSADVLKDMFVNSANSEIADYIFNKMYSISTKYGRKDTYTANIYSLLNNKESIEKLYETAEYQLDSGHQSLTLNLISVIDEIDKDPNSISKFRAKLENNLLSSNEYKKLKAIEALRFITAEWALDLSIKSLGDTNSKVREEAARSITSHRNNYGTDVIIPKLIAALNSNNPITRIGAVKILGLYNNNEAVNAIIKALKDKDPAVRQSAARMLGGSERTSSVEPLIAALNDENPEVQAAAALSLGEIGSLNAVDPLILTLKNPNVKVRQSAVNSLGKIIYERRIVDETSILSLIEMLKDDNYDIRVSAMRRLKIIGKPAENVLNKIDDKIIVTVLLDMLKDKNVETRLSAVKGLGGIGDAIAVTQLMSQFLIDREKQVKVAVVEALGKIGDKRAIKTVTSAIDSLDSDIRFAAIQAIVKLEGKDAVGKIENLKNDPSSKVRDEVITILNEYNLPVQAQNIAVINRDARSYVHPDLVSADFKEAATEWTQYYARATDKLDRFNQERDSSTILENANMYLPYLREWRDIVDTIEQGNLGEAKVKIANSVAAEDTELEELRQKNLDKLEKIIENRARTLSDVVKDIPIITPEIKQWYQGLEEGFLRANFPALSDVQLKEVLDSDDRVQTLSDLGYSDNEIMLRMGGLPAQAPAGETEIGVEPVEGVGFEQVFGNVEHPSLPVLSSNQEVNKLGLSAKQAEVMKENSRGVVTVYEYIAALKSGWADGYGFGLGLSEESYRKLTALGGHKTWGDAYNSLFRENTLNPDERTPEFMEMLTSEQVPIVFFLPPNVFTHENAGSTARELQWLLDHPARMEEVYFVVGGYEPKLEEYLGKYEETGLFMNYDVMDEILSNAPAVPRISVIIPAYKENKETLGRLLERLKEQENVDVNDIEIIVSIGTESPETDQGVIVAKQFKEQNPDLNMKIVVSEPSGPSGQRNNGARQATSDLLVFLDADVDIEKQFLAKGINEIEKKGLEVAGTYAQLNDPEFDIWDKLFWGMTNTAMQASQYVNPQALGQTIFVTKNIYDEVGGFDEEIKFAEDGRFVNAASKKAGFSKFKMLSDVKTGLNPRRFTSGGRFSLYMKLIGVTVYNTFGGKIKNELSFYRFGEYEQTPELTAGADIENIEVDARGTANEIGFEAIKPTEHESASLLDEIIEQREPAIGAPEIVESEDQMLVRHYSDVLLGKTITADPEKVSELEERVAEIERELADNRNNKELINEWSETLAAKLRVEGVDESYITDARQKPDFSGEPDKLVEYMRQRANSPKQVLTDEQIFDLYRLRFQSYWDTATLWQGVEQNRNKQKEDMGDTFTALHETVKKLKELYPEHSRVYLARDALTLLETELTLNPESSSYSIWFSRHTLFTEQERIEFAELFAKGKKNLNSEERMRFDDLEKNGGVISKDIKKLVQEVVMVTINGYGNVIGVKQNLAKMIKEKMKDDHVFEKAMDDIYNSVYQELLKQGALKDGKIVFVDTCCESYPLFLQALFEVKGSTISTGSFYWATYFKDPGSGVKTDIKEVDKTLDALYKYVNYDPESTDVPQYRNLAPITAANAYYGDLLIQNQALMSAQC